MSEVLPVAPLLTRRDLVGVVVIGAAVGVLTQPILSNVVLDTGLAIRIGVFFGFLVLAPVALLAAALLGRIVRVLYQFAKFAAVGALNAFIDLGVLNLLIEFTGIATGVNYALFKGIAFVVANVNSYFWNKHWTFGSKRPMTAREVGSFFGISVVSFVANVGVASVVVNLFPRPGAITPELWANVGALAGIVVALLANFLGYKYLVFKQAPPSA